WYPWLDLHQHWRRFELRASALGYTGVGAHDRICTDTGRVLSALPLRWATWAGGVRILDSVAADVRRFKTSWTKRDQSLVTSAATIGGWSRWRDSHSRGAMPGSLQNCCCRC